jgi:hypothetical protein
MRRLIAILLVLTVSGCAIHQTVKEARCDQLHETFRNDINDQTGGLHDIVHEINVIITECGA